MYKKDIYISKLKKVSLLACKCLFYRPEHNAKGEPHSLEMEKWNIPTDRAQRVDEKVRLFV